MMIVLKDVSAERTETLLVPSFFPVFSPPVVAPSSLRQQTRILRMNVTKSKSGTI
jgi:hypothetical protein